MTATPPSLSRQANGHRVTPLHGAVLALMVCLVLSVGTGGAVKGPRPLVITRGGTYSGTFESRDPKVPAVTIKTSQPVTLRRSVVRGAGDLIVSSGARANVSIIDVQGQAFPPTERGRCAGRFVSIENFRNIRIENCSLEGTSGIYLLDYAGDETRGQSVLIQRNVAHNIDGRTSDGKGGYTKEPQLVQFVQLDKVRHVPGMRIAWNQVINEPGQSSVEDVISVYLSSGRRGSPLSIHDNYICGAYPQDPLSSDYSGGGIMLGDGVAKDGPKGDPAYVVAFDNQVLDTVNYGIAISAGHDLRFYRNRIMSSGQLPDRKRITAQNVGAYVWDSYHAGPKRFYNNSGDDNLIGWTDPKGGRNDWWRPDAARWDGNNHLLGDVTENHYGDEFKRWQAKLAAAKITLGPRRAR